MTKTSILKVSFKHAFHVHTPEKSVIQDITDPSYVIERCKDNDFLMKS